MQRPDPSRLVTIAQHYAAARGLSMARVATLVANNGNFFIRLAGGGDVVTGTYNRVLDYFVDPANWPDALIPDHVRPLLPVVDTDNSRDIEQLAAASDVRDTDSVSRGDPAQQEVAA